MTSLTQIARRAYDRAVDDLFDARDAGKISRVDASAKFQALTAAYQTRKENMRLAGFLRRNRIDQIIARNAPEHNDLRPGETAQRELMTQLFDGLARSISSNRAA
jgi:hypothetical protein